ncbi:hypothetical protein AGDE_01629 [Angomonas deanei]|nr:hypothetical protein AGDE_01629 [Angomonas deanei]|eukprot:EPY42294.1 hypothetical protein AGDE_01629 [Angomonas deanei]
MFKMLLFPDQAFFTIATMLLAGFTYYACFRTPKDGVSAHSRQVLGGYSDDQLFQRNSEMGQIFEYHKDTIKNSLGEVEQPAIFEAPVGYTSRSGIFTPKKE